MSEKFVRLAKVLAICTTVLAAGCGSTSGAGVRRPGSEGYVDPGPWDGPLAQKHAGKVLFSSAPIPYNGTDDSSLYTRYELGAPLYIRLFSAESPANLLPGCQEPRAIYRLDINGAGAGKQTSQLEPFGSVVFGSKLVQQRVAVSLTSESSIPMTADPATVDKESAEVISAFSAKAIVPLRDGENTVRVVVDLDCGASTDANPLLAEGTLTIDVKPGAKASYLGKAGPKLEPSPHPENDALVPEILSTMKSVPDWKNEVIIGARVTSPTWTPIRHEGTGELMRRSVSAVVIVRAKEEPNPEACRIFELGFSRDVDGGPLALDDIGESTAFVCSNAPK